MEVSLVDEQWERIDPTPDARGLFVAFDKRFFDGCLAGCEVIWSPRMTLCAGLCHYEGRGGLCSIRLSQPLLKLRPRKDLVETLLHEMIHAYLFVTENDRDRNAHGASFLAHMRRINASAGTNISVYHSFHDEVGHYQRHVWRCDGPCRLQPPRHGYLRRAMNRAPSANDFWWREHMEKCGGAYLKVSEPADYGKGKAKSKKSAAAAALGNTTGAKAKSARPALSKIAAALGATATSSAAGGKAETDIDLCEAADAGTHCTDADATVETVQCPACDAAVPPAAINAHLDNDCASAR